MPVDPDTIDDPTLVRRLMKNAEKEGMAELVLRCQVRIAQLAGRDYDDELEREFWVMIAVAEEIVTQRNGRTTRLSRTRQKVKRVGVVQCLTDWALDPRTTQGFTILVEGGRPDLTGESIVVRHPDKFSKNVVQAARMKLDEHGIDVLSAPGNRS